HHGVAEGYQGVHAAENQTVDDLLQQYFHKERSLLLCVPVRTPFAKPEHRIGAMVQVAKNPPAWVVGGSKWAGL
ncbi:hypothetical protein, partial [uncultured Pseudacidovorax sp.]|uniref:hypothetical protein n=1 Tax=uncultured Pseudacidovorax sp. TaxID=679313 RepID=UPI0025CFA2CA